MPHKPWIIPNLQNLIKRYEAGEPLDKLARESGKNRKTLCNHFIRAGVAIRHTNAVALDSTQITQAFLGGESVKSLADRFDIARSAITRVLKENGITTRNRSEGMFTRMAQTTKSERLRLAENAHKAAKGRVKTLLEKSLAALTRQANVSTRSSVYETQFLEMVESRGITAIPQFAVGPYSCDLMVEGIAVEIFGGQWHRHGDHAARSQKRTHYILDSGFHFYAIWCGTGNPITLEALNDFISFLEITSSNPTSRREYRVIGGAGNFVASGSADDDYISGVGSFKAS